MLLFRCNTRDIGTCVAGQKVMLKIVSGVGKMLTKGGAMEIVSNGEPCMNNIRVQTIT